MSEKRKRGALIVDVKSKIIKCVEDNPAKEKLDITKEFKIPPRMLATILKNKETFEEGNKLSSKSKRAKSCVFEDVEECVL